MHKINVALDEIDVITMQCCDGDLSRRNEVLAMERERALNWYLLARVGRLNELYRINEEMKDIRNKHGS